MIALMDGSIHSSAEDVQTPLYFYSGTDWCRGYLFEDNVNIKHVSKEGGVKEYVNYVNIPEYGLDCLSRHSKS